MTRIADLLLCFAIFLGGSSVMCAGNPVSERVAVVTNTPGIVAFWDFVKRESGGAKRFTAHIPQGATNDYALDAANYVREYWGQGREASYADFPLLGRGPFGDAIRIQKETDPMLTRAALSAGGPR